MIITNEDRVNNKQKVTEIFKIMDDIRDDMIENFRVEKNKGKRVDTKDPLTLSKLNRYINQNSKKYVSQYKNVLKKYKIKVRFIKY